MHLKPIAVSNINSDIWKKIVEGGLYKYPIKPKVGKNFAVLDIFFMGYL
jgi:hypothetical protein